MAVTFTEKAAGEMKLRLRSEIEKARTLAAPEERDRLVRALEELELARIGTIHAFCGDLLHERPVEAGIDPLFEVASEEEAEALADEAFEDWFQRALADPPEGVRRILRRRSGRQSPREQLRSAMQGLCEHRDFPEPWRRDPFDRNGAIDECMHELAQLGDLAATDSWPDDRLTRNLAEIARFVEETTRIEAVRGRDYDGLEAELRSLYLAQELELERCATNELWRSVAGRGPGPPRPGQGRSRRLHRGERCGSRAAASRSFAGADCRL